jgi:hypothetical protein
MSGCANASDRARRPILLADVQADTTFDEIPIM